jgi:hypothetical protein
MLRKKENDDEEDEFKKNAPSATLFSLCSLG